MFNAGNIEMNSNAEDSQRQERLRRRRERERRARELNKGKCGWLDAERDIGNVGVKVCIKLENVFVSC